MAADKRKDIARDLARRYGTLTPAELDQLTAIITPVKLTRGQLAVQYGDICRNIYYVQRGLVRQVYVKNGKECTEHISYEGGIVMCIESLFNETPSTLAVEALEPTTLYAIPYKEYMELAQVTFNFCSILLAILKESLIVSQHKADTLRFESARDRYTRTLIDHPDIIRRAPLHIVASYLQMTPETLSRVRTIVSEDL